MPSAPGEDPTASSPTASEPSESVPPPAPQDSEPEQPSIYYISFNDTQVDRTLRAYKGARNFHVEGDKDQDVIDQINRLIYYVCQVTGRAAQDDSGIHDTI